MAELRPYELPLDESKDSKTQNCRRPLGVGWNQKSRGEGIPPTLSPGVLVDVAYHDDSRWFGPEAREVDWESVLWWRYNGAFGTRSIHDLATAAGLTERQEKSPDLDDRYSWREKPLGGGMPLLFEENERIDVVYSNDEKQSNILTDEVRDWLAVVRYRRSPPRDYLKSVLEKNKRHVEFLKTLNKQLRQDRTAIKRSEVVKRIDDHLRETE